MKLLANNFLRFLLLCIVVSTAMSMRRMNTTNIRNVSSGNVMQMGTSRMAGAVRNNSTLNAARSALERARTMRNNISGIVQSVRNNATQLANNIRGNTGRNFSGIVQSVRNNVTQLANNARRNTRRNNLGRLANNTRSVASRQRRMKRCSEILIDSNAGNRMSVNRPGSPVRRDSGVYSGMQGRTRTQGGMNGCSGRPRGDVRNDRSRYQGNGWSNGPVDRSRARYQPVYSDNNRYYWSGRSDSRGNEERLNSPPIPPTRYSEDRYNNRRMIGGSGKYEGVGSGNPSNSVRQRYGRKHYPGTDTHANADRPHIWRCGTRYHPHEEPGMGSSKPPQPASTAPTATTASANADGTTLPDKETTPASVDSPEVTESDVELFSQSTKADVGTEESTTESAQANDETEKLATESTKADDVATEKSVADNPESE